MGGLGLGSQIGLELTDFVFILNDAAAVRTFAAKGTLTIAGNVSIAAGPVGRNAEAAGAVSAKGVAAIFSYSKTQGFFAGISLEGTAMGTRGDTNARAYQRSGIQPAELLDGSVPPPPAADPLMRVLQSRVFASSGNSRGGMYNDVPVYDDRHDDVIWEGRRGQGVGEGQPQYQSRRRTWADDPSGDRRPTSTAFSNVSAPARASTFAGGVSGVAGQRTGVTDAEYVYRDRPPSRPTAPKPVFTPKSTMTLGPHQARAKFQFDGDQPGDLPFRKGEIITIVKRTESLNDWWTGRIGDKEGVFPSNYVEVG